MESRADTVKAAWQASLAHLRQRRCGQPPVGLGQGPYADPRTPAGPQQPLHLLFNVGPFARAWRPRCRTTCRTRVGPAPWSVYGPSTHGAWSTWPAADQALGINPTGQSGVPFDGNYADQAEGVCGGRYLPMHFAEADVQDHTRGTLELHPSTEHR